jgi:DNA mismatch repair protein MutL
MGKIHVLDSFIANQIAAGEVIERPVSVVKELVENAIDAGSTAITVEIRDGGISYIRVTDNGVGIDSEDVSLAFQRHATSKIRTVKDLNQISTLGFRGEALASIAAVSQLEMVTRTSDSISGTKLVNHGGKIHEINETGCPEGTTVIVRNLFYNTPARMKFLKKSSLEAGYVGDLLVRLILANPGISVKFINNGKVVYHTPGDGDLFTALFSVYGKDLATSVYPMEYSEGNVKIWGYIGSSDAARGNRNHQTFFVNGRFIKSLDLSRVVEDAYGTRLTTNRFPSFVLHIDLPFDMADVNVHPNKTEIRFANEQYIRSLLHRAVENCLARHIDIPNLLEDSGKGHAGEMAGFITEKGQDQSREINRIHETAQQIPYTRKAVSQTPIDDREKDTDQLTYISIPSSRTPLETGTNKEKYGIFSDKDAHNNNVSNFHALRIIGQLFSTYILVEENERFYMIDQHAAHERLLYEKFKKNLAQQAIMSQQLMIPHVIEVTYSEKTTIDEHLFLIRQLGFEIDTFGPMAYQVRAVPYILGEPQVKSFFTEMLDQLSDIKALSTVEAKQDRIMQLACKKAIKAGDTLDRREIIELLQLVAKEGVSLTCPHGRPIMVSMTRYELEKRFKRVQ